MNGVPKESGAELEKSGRFSKPIATEIVPLTEFYTTEEYHQDYYRKITIATNSTTMARAAINL